MDALEQMVNVESVECAEGGAGHSGWFGGGERERAINQVHLLGSGQTLQVHR